MIDLTRNIKMLHHHIKLNSGFFKDLEMWKRFIVNWDGANFFLLFYMARFRLPATPHRCFRSNMTWGYLWVKMVARHLATSPAIRNTRDSHCLARTFCHYSRLSDMGDLLRDKRIIFKCDNEAVVSMINTKRSRLTANTAIQFLHSSSTHSRKKK